MQKSNEAINYTVTQLFDTMNERFRPDKAGNLEVTIVYEFGDGRKWTVRIFKGTVQVDSDDSAGGDENIRVFFKDESVLLGLVANTIDPFKAYRQKDLRLAGNWELLGKVRASFEVPEELRDIQIIDENT